MKKLLFVILFVFIAGAIFATNPANVKSNPAECEITAFSNMNFGKSIQKVWKLDYGADNQPVTIIKRKSAEGTEYVVYSSYFEISYLSGKAGFGVKNIRKSWKTLPASITNAVISKDKMKLQKVITPLKVDDEYAIGLISSFLPDLLNTGYEHLLS